MKKSEKGSKGTIHVRVWAKEGHALAVDNKAIQVTIDVNPPAGLARGQPHPSLAKYDPRECVGAWELTADENQKPGEVLIPVEVHYTDYVGKAATPRTAKLVVPVLVP